MLKNDLLYAFRTSRFHRVHIDAFNKPHERNTRGSKLSRTRQLMKCAVRGHNDRDLRTGSRNGGRYVSDYITDTADLAPGKGIVFGGHHTNVGLGGHDG